MSFARKQSVIFSTEGTVNAQRVNASVPIVLTPRTAAPIEAAPSSERRIDSSLFAASRVAGRLDAQSISQAELDALLEERAALLDKKFDGTITRAEENRLAYVRWSLDRIEDARHGHSLDALEQQIELYESLRNDIERFIRKLSAQMMSHSR